VTYFFETYGCQMNFAESAAMDRLFRDRGWTGAADGDAADLVLIHTCSVRETAEQRALGRLAQYAALKKKRKEQNRPLTLAVGGCMAQRLGRGLQAKIPEVDYVLGTAARSLLPSLLAALEQGRKPEAPSGAWAFTDAAPAFPFSPLHTAEPEPGAKTIRSFIPVMQGCGNYCSYCIVPSVRGPEVSRDPAAIEAEIRLAAAQGVREITLLGQNVNAYRWEGLDFSGLLALTARAVEQTPIRWVRFLSANPKNFSPQAVQVMADNRVFCRHLHLCVQHGSNRVLRAMNRGYTREAYLALVEIVRKAMPEISFSTDILIGFPGETEEDLEETLTLMEEVRFLSAYMYHYNPREGTAAYTLPCRISEGVKRERLGRVIALQKKHTQELLQSRLGRRERVLIEGVSRKNADELVSRTERQETAVVPGGAALSGFFGELTLDSLRGNTFRSRDIRILE
jgi:tRNA-2-methylthio-N6-dimethylallyladenosine synthase